MISDWKPEYGSGYETHARELARLIDAGLRSLPPMTRQVFELHRFDEKSLAEIAVLLGLNVRAVEQHLAAALFHLHQIIHAKR